MIHALAKRITALFFDEKDRYPKEIYSYGIEIIISVIIGTILVLILGCLLGKVIESILFLLSLSVLRSFTGGYHAKNYLCCNIILCSSFILSTLTYIIIINRYNLLLNIGIFVVSIILVIKYVPVKNTNKNIVDNKRKYRIISLGIITAQLFSSVFVYHLFGIYQVLIILPTILTVDISIFAEIIIQKRRKNHEEKNEKSKSYN